MVFPFYKNHDAPEKPGLGNAGLYFERFYDQYNEDFTKIDDTKKIAWLTKFSQSTGDTPALQENAHKQINLSKQLKGSFKFFNTQWHFVTGMGYPHPLENGLNWHPVYGVPYLTGAAVKGILRAWVEQWIYDDTQTIKKQQQLLKWFGSTHKKPETEGYQSSTGSLIFFDALPVEAVSIKVDIMTPHQDQWYTEGAEIRQVDKEPEKIPADWHAPVPIPFLVVDRKTSFLFTIAPRNTESAKEIDMDEVFDCLTEALEWLGAGAKTATGYGQMEFDKQTDELYRKDNAERQRKKEFADKIKDYSPTAQDYFSSKTDKNWLSNKEAFAQNGNIEHWLDKMEQSFDLTIVADLKELINQHFNGLLDNPMKMKGKKGDKAAYNQRQQAFAKRLIKLAKNL